MRQALKFPMRRTKFGLACLLFFTGLIAVLPVPAQSDDLISSLRGETGSLAPIVVVNVASVERLTTDLDYLFRTIDRPDITEFLVGMLAYAGDLQGVDRTRPFGVMLFIQGLNPRPIPVAYIPVQDLNGFIETLSLTPLSIRESDSGPDRYELAGRRETLYLQLQKDYVFISSDDQIISGELPDPVSYNSSLTSRYDLSVALRISNISSTVRNIFVTFLRASSQPELQQRDGEPEAAYRIRRANAISTLQTIEQLLLECDQILIGIDASEERKTAVLEINTDAVPGSEFASQLVEFAGTPTAFTPLINEGAPLSISGAWRLNQRDQTSMQEWALAARSEMNRVLPQHAEEGGAISRLFDSITATIEDGHVDFFTQFATPAPRRFVLLGGGRIVGGQTFGTALQEILATIDAADEIESMQLNIETFQGVAIHRIQGRNVSDGDLRLYGGRPAAYIGTGSRYVWFAVGGEDALPTLKNAIEKMATATPEERSRVGVAPFQLVAHVSPWLNLTNEQEAQDEIGRRIFQLTQQAFEPSNDTVRIEVRPTDTGVRFRFQIDEGFLKMMALGISELIDRSL